MHKKAAWALLALFVTIGFAEAQEASLFQPHPPVPQPGLWHRLYIQAGCGYNLLPVSLMKLGDSSLTQAPPLQGRNCLFAYGAELPRITLFGRKLPKVFLQEEYERGPIGGKGSLMEGPPSQNPYGPMHGNLTLLASSHNGAAEVVPFEKGRLQFFTGFSFPGKLSLRHHANGYMVIPDPPGQIIMPVQDNGSDRRSGIAFRVGIRIRVANWFSPGIGAYARDGVTSMGTITSHFGYLIPNPFKRHRTAQ